MKTYATARLDEIDALADGRYRYRPVRHHFGITSFGVTAWVGAAAGDPIINEYDEESEPAEELFVVVSGRAIFEVEDEEVEAAPGTLIFTRPGTRRTAVAAEPGTTILVFDGRPGKAYEATGWELWAPFRPLYDCGEHAELRARLQDAIAANPQYPMLVYNLACSESLSGHTAEAIDHLRSAVGASEKLRADAREDSDFDPIRDKPSFRALIGGPGFSTLSEREALNGFLDLQRAALLRKIDGISDSDARKTPTVSSLSLLGLLKHSALWERRWFQVVFAGRTLPGEWPESGRKAWRTDDFLVDENDTTDHWVAYYQDQAAISREIAASAELAAPCARQDIAPRNLRWVLLHLIEETARHAGHADIIRETLDGTRGI